LNSPDFKFDNNLNISADSTESTGLNHSNGLTGLNLNGGLSDGMNIRPAKVAEITYAPETQSDYKLINHSNLNDSRNNFSQNHGQNRLSDHHNTSNHAQNKNNIDLQNQASAIDVLKRRSKSPNTTDSTDGGLSFTTNGNFNNGGILDAGNGAASDFVIKAIQELVAKVQQLYDELIQEKEANSKFKSEMEKKFDAVVLRLEAAENSGKLNNKNAFDIIGDPVSALRSVQSTSTPIKNESSSVVADSQKKATSTINFDGEDLKVEVLDSGELLKNDMMQCLAAMKKTNYTGSEVAKESEEGKRLAELQAVMRDLDKKQNLVERDLEN
jgi:hypothetical protein